MDNNKTLYTIIVHSENIAGLLNQVTAVFTRRQINIESLNVSASSIKGVHKYTITCWTTPDIVEKVVRQIEKKMDVIQAHYFTDKEIFQREVAMYKVSTPEFQSTAEASKVVRRYGAHIVEVNPTYSIVEMTGMSDDITNLYQELRNLNCVLSLYVLEELLFPPVALSVSMNIWHIVRNDIEMKNSKVSYYDE